MLSVGSWHRISSRRLAAWGLGLVTSIGAGCAASKSPTSATAPSPRNCGNPLVAALESVFGCTRPTVEIRAPNEETVHGFVRLGAFRTPRNDSIVVAVVEVPDRAPDLIVLGPKDIKPGAIRVIADGRAGAAGRGGRRGNNGATCANGDEGEDGDDGAPGGSGNDVDIIVQADAAWLDQLVAVTNHGGHGGEAGIGGAGGSAGPRTTGTGAGATCTTRPGRRGRNGRPGPNGTPGQPPRTTSVPFSLLWSGSPIWSDSTSRKALETLIEFNANRG